MSEQQVALKALAPEDAIYPRKFVQKVLDDRLSGEKDAERLQTLEEVAAELHDDEQGEQELTNGARIIASLRARGVLGAWKDREDIKDSSEYARELRRQAETREW